MVTVLAFVGLAKKLFGHYAILKILSLRSPRKNTTFSTAFHRVSDVIKNVRITFEISDTRLLNALCDGKTGENNDVLEVALEKRSRLTRYLCISKTMISNLILFV